MKTVSRLRGLSSFALHLLAMAFMLGDHLWATVVPGNLWLTCLGRLAFPIYAFLLVEGYAHTKSVKRYCLRLLAFAFLSEVPFNLMTAGGFIFPFHQNVLFTLLLSLLCVWGIDAAMRRLPLWAGALAAAGIALAACLAAAVLMVDYGAAGVLTVLVFHLFRGNTRPRRLGQLAGLGYIHCRMMAGLLLPFRLFGASLLFPQQGFALAALPLIWLYSGRQGAHGRAVRWLFYGFYPAHMLVLGLWMRYWL